MIIGLTGGIACGKSIVSDALAGLGLNVVDADVIARDLVAKNSPALKEIVAYFGSKYLNADGTLNRNKLGSLIFSSIKDRLKLQAILHPRIIAEIKREIDAARRSGNDLVVCAPLLIEANITHLVDVVWVVRSQVRTMMRRLCARDELSEVEAVKRIQAQMPVEEKVKYADYVLDNEFTIDGLIEKVGETYRLSKGEFVRKAEERADVQ
jgi:dephospho-CoA kinase